MSYNQKLKIMKTRNLLPYRFKKIGWILFVPALFLGIYYLVTDFEPEFLNIQVFTVINEEIMSDSEYFTMMGNNVIDEIIGLLLIFGMAFIAMSKQKNEDEFISKIRVESLLWATYVNYAILVLAIILVYGFSFFWVLVFNMFTVLLFFIIRFNWALYKSNSRS